MNPVIEPMLTVLNELQVLSLAVCYQGMPWASNAFFAYDNDLQRLLMLGSLETCHGRMLLANPHVSGTINGQFTQIDQIHGLQYFGIAQILEQSSAREQALDIYYRRFPQARGFIAPVWEIHLLRLKFTDNRQGFGSKLQWNRHDRAPIKGLDDFMSDYIKKTT